MIATWKTTPDRNDRACTADRRTASALASPTLAIHAFSCGSGKRFLRDLRTHLACPCHLIITLPLLTLISLLAGTAPGSFLKLNTGFIYTGAGIYFVIALAASSNAVVRPETRAA